MQGKVVLITGATNGIGEVTARELAKRGATTVIIGRNEEKTRQVAAAIKQQTGNQQVDYFIADLSIMDQVRQLAQDFKAKYNQLHILVNNAGALFTNRHLTPDGYEMTFALNHLSYFLLTNLLLDTLKSTGTPNEKARIVNVSSSVHYSAKLDFDNLNGEKRFNGLSAYSVSKLENIIFTYELDRRLKEEGANVTANALHPGVVNTGFGKNNGGFAGLVAKGVMAVMRLFQISAEEGAKTTIYLATSPDVEGISGSYFEKCKPKKSSQESYNQDHWRRLWEISEELTGLKQHA